MIGTVQSVGSLLLAIFMLMAGGGFLSTLISLRLEAAGTPSMLIGLVATAYFAGLTIGSARVFGTISRVGHIRAFAAFVSLFAATSLCYIIHVDPFLWMLLRFLEGLCMAGVFVCLESWLNERAEPATRGAILAFYMASLYAGQASGQFLLNLGDVAPTLPFVAASILLSLTVIPVVLTRIPAPTLPESGIMPLAQLYRISPLGFTGAAVTGMMLGAFYGLGAVFARGVGLSNAGTAWFMSATLLGGVALQWPLGRLSDVLDRRKVIIGCFIATLLICLAIFEFAEGRYQMMLAGALFGGTCFALYPLCVAHTNDHLDTRQRVGATGGLVLIYSLGAVVGPLLGAAFMGAFGAHGLFLFIGFCALLMLAFAFWRVRLAPPVPGADQQRYQVLPRTTPAAASLDPLVPED